MKKVVLIIAIVVMAVVSCKNENPATDFDYTETENGIMITKYKGEKKNVIIPKKINNLPVVAIGDLAFSDMALISVSIPDSVSYIGENAFTGNEFTSINIPSSVESMGNNVFDSKVSLTGNTPIQENPASDFSYEENESGIIITGYKGETTNVVIPQKINNKPVVEIGNNAFEVEYYRGIKMGVLTSVVIPNSVKKIGDYAFWSNDLTSVSIPNSVETIGDCAFNGNQLSSVSIGDSVKSIGDNAFLINQLTSVVIPDSVERIGYRAFDPNVVLTGNEKIAVIAQNDHISIVYDIRDVKRDTSKYAHFTLSIKLYERDNQNQQWFDRYKNATSILIENRQTNNAENAFNVAIEGNVVRKNTSFVKSGTTASYGFDSDYGFQNTFYYEPMDKVVNVECKIKYMWVATHFYYGFELTDAFVSYSNSIYTNKKSNIDDPTGKYTLYQLSNAVLANKALPVFENAYKLCSNPDLNEGVMEVFINQ